MEFLDFLEQNVAIESKETEVCEWAYDITTERFLLRNGLMYKVYGNDALVIWAYKALKTERFRYSCYSNQYGSNIEDFIGIVLTEATKEVLKYEIEQTLSQHPSIQEARVITMTQEDEQITINVRLYTEEGEVELNGIQLEQ